MTSRFVRWISALCLGLLPQAGFAADTGLLTMPSNRTDTTVWGRGYREVRPGLDHAAAAAKNGLTLPARTVIVFGNPRLGTPSMQKAPTLAIDVPPKALVWQDDQGKVWLTVNTGEYLQDYVYPRHGLPPNPAASEGFDEFLKYAAKQTTE